MPPKGKGKAKASTKSVFSTNATPLTYDPPGPFTRAPSKLEPFLSFLDPKHIYITSIDSTPVDYKRKVFAVPVAMNLVVFALLIWRIIHIGPYYMAICSSLMGHRNEMSIQLEDHTSGELAMETLRRCGTFMLDLLLYSFVWPWPKDFFAGTLHGNPTFWRLSVGFSEKEITIRRSRKWDVQVVGDEKVLKEDSEGRKVFDENVKNAVSPTWMHQRTGYLMMNKEWDLDWSLMIAATKLVTKKESELRTDDFKTTVLVHTKEFGWLGYGYEGLRDEQEEEKARKKIMAFKDELTAMGKEGLFFRWIELIQYESSQPGGFGPERQAQAVQKARELFESQGIDFEKFWAKVGGVKGMPGLDQYQA